MGYYANAGGEIYLKDALPADFEVPLELVRNWDADIEIYDKEQIVYIDFHDKYSEYWIEEVAKLFKPYTKSGRIDFTGEDGCIWRYIYLDGEWKEENARIIFDSEPALQLQKEQKEELIGQLIGCVEDVLSDGKPSEGYIEGATYDKLSAKLADTLINWGIL